MVAGLSSYCSAHQRVPSRAQLAASLGLQHKQQPTTDHFVASSPAEATADLGLHKSPCQGAQEHPVASFGPHQNTTRTALQMTHQKGKLGWHQRPAEATYALGVRPLESQSHLKKNEVGGIMLPDSRLYYRAVWCWRGGGCVHRWGRVGSRGERCWESWTDTLHYIQK